MPAPEIIKKELVTTESIGGDNYGNTIIKTSEGATVKLSPKRQNLKTEFEIGATTDIGWAVYMDKEYVATAKRVGKSEAKPAPQSKSTPLGTQGNPISRDDTTNDSIQRQVAAKICGEWVANKVIDPGAFVPNAEWVYRWISGKLTLSPESLANIELIMVSNLQDMVDRLKAKAQTKKVAKNETPG
jgi:hypothetical protein